MRKYSREIRGWPLTPVGISWIAEGPDKIRQYLIRIGPRGQVNLEELRTVFADQYGHVAFCLNCFSQELTYDVGETIVYRCRACTHRFSFVPERKLTE